MALNPHRTMMIKTPNMEGTNSPFRAEAEAALERFRARRDELRRLVRRGELTPKVARQQAAEAARQLRAALQERGEQFQASPPLFAERLEHAVGERTRARESSSLEALQRETNKLLRDSLIEQQIQSRASEFKGRAYERPVAGGDAVPTLNSLLQFHEAATAAGDEAAREWARRELEGFRSRVAEPSDQRRIDLACDRPDHVNPRIAERYVEQMEGRSTEELETFVEHALQARDASACVAAFTLARQAPEGSEFHWVRRVLSSLDQFPDSALMTLRGLEAEARQAEAAAAREEAERVAALAEAEAEMPSLQAPSDAEVDRFTRLETLPSVATGQPIGLALDRRGLTPEEYQDAQTAPESESDATPAEAEDFEEPL